jgi:regulator of nonsense transcripts 1
LSFRRDDGCTETFIGCVFYKLIVGEEGPSILGQVEPPPETASPAPEGLNKSQILAMSSGRTPLSLIWGPPGMTVSHRLISFLFERCYGE